MDLLMQRTHQQPSSGEHRDMCRNQSPSISVVCFLRIIN